METIGFVFRLLSLPLKTDAIHLQKKKMSKKKKEQKLFLNIIGAVKNNGVKSHQLSLSLFLKIFSGK